MKKDNKKEMKDIKKVTIPEYDENSIMMHWSNTSNTTLPVYDENSIMMHWSNTGF